MASEEERTETASEAPREDTHEDHDEREPGRILKSQEQAPEIITLMITLSRLSASQGGTLTRSSVVRKEIWLKTLNLIPTM